MNTRTAAGATPPGTSGEQQASRWVEHMFGGIAPRYDLINHLLSFNIDRSWRQRLVNRLAPVLENPDAKILDLCCGTGDVLLDLQAATSARVMGADFCHPMLIAARNKSAAKGIRAPLFEGDALALPLPDQSLDAIAISFGFRNLANYANGLHEFARTLKPGGLLAILEFSHPRALGIKAAYACYSRLLLPAVGWLFSGSWQAYSYLPASIRKFPTAARLCEMMVAVGFTNARYELLTGGIAALHIASRPPVAAAR